MYKLGHMVRGQWVEYSHPPVYHVHKKETGQQLVAGVPGGDVEIFRRLVASTEPPYDLLYILHTPRGEGAPGRYQSPPISGPEFHGFIERFKELLSRDARFDIWARSAPENALVVWDRHNRIFAYGPVQRFEAQLRMLGFSLGEPTIPAPHEHHYRAELDSVARSLLGVYKWAHSPLQPEDEQ